MITSDEWRNAVIAQDDDNDYSESGWVCWKLGDRFYLGRYSHCSCYGTFDSLCGGSIGDYMSEGTPDFTWEGGRAELADLVAGKMDPAVPDRPASTDDYDSDHLMAVYSQLTDWLNTEEAHG